jgi:hypothetical protein
MSFQKTFPLRATLAALTALSTLGAFGPAQAAHAASYTRVTGPVSFAARAAAAPSSTDLVVDLAGINSYDQQGATLNTVLALDALPGGTVDLVAWSFSLGTVGLSWLSEAAVRITNSDGVGVAFIPGDGDDLSGVRAYAGGGSLLAEGVSFSVLADGKLYVEFYETWDDAAGAADAVYQSGSLTLAAVAAAVPEPAAFGLMALGLLGVAGAARRRRSRDRS